MREAVISSGRPLVYPLWLASPLLSGSPRRVAPFAFFTRYAIYSTVATRDGYGIPWYSTTSLDVPKVCRAADYRALHPCLRLAPKPLGSGNSLRHQATVVLSFPLRRPWAVRIFPFVLGSLLKGFFAPVHPFVGFLRAWLSYAFLPISLGWWLVCG